MFFRDRWNQRSIQSMYHLMKKMSPAPKRYNHKATTSLVFSIFYRVQPHLANWAGVRSGPNRHARYSRTLASLRLAACSEVASSRLRVLLMALQVVLSLVGWILFSFVYIFLFYTLCWEMLLTLVSELKFCWPLFL